MRSRERRWGPRTLDIDLIVAVGGGSSLDCAKAINLLTTNPVLSGLPAR